jgi:acetate kinase
MAFFMRDLVECETQDVRASEAVELFCYQVKKWIGGLADASRVAVSVMHTDEEWMIAKTVCDVLGLIVKKEHDHENKKGV